MKSLRLPVTLLLLSLVVTAPLLAGTSDDLQRAREARRRGALAESESLSAVAMARLDRIPIVDSLALADALFGFSFARYWNSSHTDTLGRRAAARALAIYRRRVPMWDDRSMESALLCVRWAFNSGLADSSTKLSEEMVRERGAHVAAGDTLYADAWRSLAMARRDGGDRAGARAAFESTMVWSERASGQRRLYGSALAEIGRIDNQLGLQNQAREEMLRSLDVLRRSEGPDAFATTVPLDYLSTLERNAGRLTHAIDYAQEALRVARVHLPDDDYEVARIRRNMATVLSALGDYAGSLALLSEVRPVYERTFGPRHWRIGSLLSSMGIARGGMRDSTGMTPLREAESIYMARPGSPDPELARVLHTQALIQYTFGNPASALSTCERALQLKDGGNQNLILVLGQLRILKVLSRIDLGDTTALAAAYADMARYAADRSLDSSGVAAEWRAADAIALRALGREEDSWRSALRAEQIDRDQSIQLARTQGDELALIAAARVSPRLEMLFDWARGMGAGRMEEAWDRCVRDRGLVRTEMARRHVPAELRGDTALVRAHARWVEAQEELARAVLGSGSAPARSREAVAEAERSYARELADHHHVIPPAEPTLAEVRANLAPGAALVSFVEFTPHRDSTRLLALVARGGQSGIAYVDLGASVLVREEVDAWKRLLARSPGALPAQSRAAEREARRLGEQVRRRVWDRLTPLVEGASDLYLVPDGPVLELPWQALPTRPGRYLIEDGPPLHMLLAERDLLAAAEDSRSPSLLAMGSPDFGPPPSAAAIAANRAATRSAADLCANDAPFFGSLPATLDEVRDVATAWSAAGGRVRQHVGAAATERAFKRDAPGSTVLHLATHGIVLGDRCAEAVAGTRGVGGLSALSAPVRPAPGPTRTPPRSTGPAVMLPPAPPSPWVGRRTWLALAGAQSPSADANGEDGRLTAEEVVTLDLSGTDWVVLSACHSGLGENWSLEGSLGMRRAFALAGARAVIASEWAVEDRATREWMALLHRARARGEGTAAAMATASRAVLRARREQGRTTHPFYWAAFTASGD